MEEEEEAHWLFRRCWRRNRAEGAGSAKKRLAGLGQESTAARPLDGGVLTRWGARAPARGPATAPWSARSFALGHSVALRLRKEKRESSEAKRERLNEMT